ncbi:MAG: LuxR C-terminal-related transcriptional regulator [Caldilinea sp.]|nr:LuxR C-terminal-related transcriptional regulator [Caldilinea sp.]MDW8440555.1 LuxR C-terminal-related transcriptional regulator [Caldilineaceae bacterium]
MVERDATPVENPLSEREMEVARLLATGASNAEIARELVISPHTVKVHLRNIFEKLQVNSRTEATMVLVQRGWLIVPGAVVEAVEKPPPSPPEPPPIQDLPGYVASWQRTYLVAVLSLCILLFIAPLAGAWMAGAPDLLTNAKASVTAPPSLQLDSRWQARAPLRFPLGRHAMVNLGGVHFVLGGETNGGATLDAVSYYDPTIGAWVSAVPLPMPLANLAAATHGERIYAAGGSRSQPDGKASLSDLLLAYDVALGRWEEISRLPYPVAGAALVADDGALYLLGGWDGQTMRDEIWRFPLPKEGEDNGWEQIGHLAKARAFLGAAFIQGDIYVGGGYDGEHELDLLERFTPATGELRELAPMATPRGGLALVFDGVALYALGGGWTRTLINLERYDLITNAWSNFPSPIEGEWRHLAAVGDNGQIVITGGWAGDYLDSQLQYQSSFRALLPVITSD